MLNTTSGSKVTVKTEPHLETMIVWEQETSNAKDKLKSNIEVKRMDYLMARWKKEEESHQTTKSILTTHSPTHLNNIP
jgi:hypothetical protein